MFHRVSTTASLSVAVSARYSAGIWWWQKWTLPSNYPNRRRCFCSDSRNCWRFVDLLSRTLETVFMIHDGSYHEFFFELLWSSCAGGNVEYNRCTPSQNPYDCLILIGCGQALPELLSILNERGCHTNSDNFRFIYRSIRYIQCVLYFLYKLYVPYLWLILV